MAFGTCRQATGTAPEGAALVLGDRDRRQEVLARGEAEVDLRAVIAAIGGRRPASRWPGWRSRERWFGHSPKVARVRRVRRVHRPDGELRHARRHLAARHAGEVDLERLAGAGMLAAAPIDQDAAAGAAVAAARALDRAGSAAWPARARRRGRDGPALRPAGMKWSAGRRGGAARAAELEAQIVDDRRGAAARRGRRRRARRACERPPAGLAAAVAGLDGEAAGGFRRHPVCCAVPPARGRGAAAAGQGRCGGRVAARAARVADMAMPVRKLVFSLVQAPFWSAGYPPAAVDKTAIFVNRDGAVRSAAGVGATRHETKARIARPQVYYVYETPMRIARPRELRI